MPRGLPRKNAAGATAPAATRGRANNQPQVPFARKLVLNQWLLSLFNVKRFEDLAEHLRSEALEGLDENNIHDFREHLISCGRATYAAVLANPDSLPDHPAAMDFGELHFCLERRASARQQTGGNLESG